MADTPSRSETGFGGISSASGTSARRSIVRGHYRRTGAAGKAKASARYIETRENDLGRSQERELFTRDQDALVREEVYSYLEHAEKTREFQYSLVIAPETDRDADHTDLHAYTREVMVQLERQTSQDILWVAGSHEGSDAHTEHAHVHVIAALDAEITEGEFKRTREFAAEAFNRHLEMALDMQQGVGTQQLENHNDLASSHTNSLETSAEVENGSQTPEPTTMETSEAEGAQIPKQESFEVRRDALIEKIRRESEGQEHEPSSELSRADSLEIE